MTRGDTVAGSAAGAAEGETEESSAGGADAIDHGLDAILLEVDATFEVQ